VLFRSYQLKSINYPRRPERINQAVFEFRAANLTLSSRGGTAPDQVINPYADCYFCGGKGYTTPDVPDGDPIANLRVICPECLRRREREIQRIAV